MTTVLFVRLSAMGDLVQGLGAIAALHAVRPQWRLRVVTQTTFAPLLAGLPSIADVVTFDRRGGLRAVLATRAAMRREPNDVAIDLQGNWKSALLARLAGARDCLGIERAWRQEAGSAWLLRRCIAASGVPHPATAALALVRAVAPEASVTLPRLVAAAPELERERAALQQLGVDAARPFRVVVVTDPVDARALRAAHVRALTADRDMPCVHLFGPAESHLPAAEGVPSVRHVPGEVRRLVALGELVQRAGGEVAGPDQGASHVLAAAGARCRVWFGAMDPLRTAPPGAVALVHPAPPPCSPCGSARCRNAAGVVCMEFATPSASGVTQTP